MSYVSPGKMKSYIDKVITDTLDNRYEAKGSGSGGSGGSGGSNDNDCYTKAEIDEMIGGMDETLNSILGEGADA